VVVTRHQVARCLVRVRLVDQACLRSCLLPVFQEIVVIPAKVRSVIQTTLPLGQDRRPDSESRATAALAGPTVSIPTAVKMTSTRRIDMPPPLLPLPVRHVTIPPRLFGQGLFTASMRVASSTAVRRSGT
jgi:hypothetical protein